MQRTKTCVYYRIGRVGCYTIHHNFQKVTPYILEPKIGSVLGRWGTRNINFRFILNRSKIPESQLVDCNLRTISFGNDTTPHSPSLFFPVIFFKSLCLLFQGQSSLITRRTPRFYSVSPLLLYGGPSIPIPSDLTLPRDFILIENYPESLTRPSK